jgi:hypothetical protein
MAFDHWRSGPAAYIRQVNLVNAVLVKPGCPLRSIGAASGWLSVRAACTVAAIHDSGDHAIVIGDAMSGAS